MPSRREVRPDDDPFSPEYFSWKVGGAGYQWEPRQFFGTIDGDRFTYTERVLISSALGAARTYNPLAEPELFRKFGECRIREDDMAAFAGTYGLLGVGEELDDLWQHRWPKGLTRASYGERLSTWQREILAMRAAVRIWDSLEVGFRKALPIFVLPEPHPVEPRPDHTYYESVDEIGAESTFAVRTADDDLDAHHFFAEMGGKHPFVDCPKLDSADAAWRLLVRLVNHRLLSHCGPYLFWAPRRLSLMVRVAPQNLLGAVWWQFARVVSGEASYTRCKTCGKLIELSRGDGFRSDREFCSNACKAKDHREKVKQVKALRAKGWNVRRIAKEFDTEPETVKKWLEKKK